MRLMERLADTKRTPLKIQFLFVREMNNFDSLVVGLLLVAGVNFSDFKLF